MNSNIRNGLTGIGCPACVIEELEAASQASRKLAILKNYRRELLDSVHREQQKLQDLDYLIFQLRQGK